MATPIRPKDIPTTATTEAADDYYIIDGATNGTRKIAKANVAKDAIAAHNDDAGAHGVYILKETGTPAGNGLALAQAISVARTVFFDVDCLIATSLLLKSNSRLVGLGNARIRAVDNFGNFPLVRNENFASETLLSRDHDIAIENVWIDGNKAGNSTASEFSACIQFLGVANASVSGCTLTNAKGDGIAIGASSGFPAVVCSGFTSERNNISGCARNGISITELNVGSVAFGVITGCGLHGIDLECNVAESIIRDVAIIAVSVVGSGSSSTCAGLAVDTSELGSVINTSIRGCSVVNQTGFGVWFRGATNISVSDCTVSVTSNVGIKEEPSAITRSSGVRINDCTVSDSAAIAVQIASTNPSIIRNVLALDSGAAGFTFQNSSTGDSFVGLVAKGCASHGIVITEKTLFTASGCVVDGNAGTGIYSISCDRGLISGCAIYYSSASASHYEVDCTNMSIVNNIELAFTP